LGVLLFERERQKAMCDVGIGGGGGGGISLCVLAAALAVILAARDRLLARKTPAPREPPTMNDMNRNEATSRSASEIILYAD
jgi:hypothetical protein